MFYRYIKISFKNFILYFLTFFLESLYKIKYRNILKGKDCFLLGSSNVVDLTLFKQDMVVISVNGSAANAEKLHLPKILLTILDNELLDPICIKEKISRKYIIENKLLKNINLGTLICVQSNNSKGGDPLILEAHFNDYIKFNRFLVKKIIAKTTKSKLINKNINGLPSTGFTALAICFWLGAKSVSMTGFSFYENNNSIFDSHFYNQNDLELADKVLNTRSHTLADSAILTSLVLNKYKVITKDHYLLPLIQNWGNFPPQWAQIRKYKNN